MTAASDSGPDLFQSPLPDQQLVIIAGKGGVGRSTVAAGLALACANAGERVLLVDVINHAGTRLALGSRSLKNGGKLLELTTALALDEYLKIYLKFPIPASRLGPISRIFDYVATAAPGVTEILTIGKVGHDVRGGTWDRVIVDGPATGHVVELIAAPDNIGGLLSFGPLAAQTDWLSDILEDPGRTGIWIVATPEELPVTEALQLADRIEVETRVSLAGAVINRMPTVLTDEAMAEADQLAAGDNPGLAAAGAIIARANRTAMTEATRFADVWNSTELPLRFVYAAQDPTDQARRMWSGLR